MKIILSNYRYFMSGGPEKYLFMIQGLLRDHGHQIFPFSIKSSKNVPSSYEDHFLSSVGDGNSAYFDQYDKSAKTIFKVLERQLYSPEAFFKAKSFGAFCKADLIYSLQFQNKMSPALLDGFKAAGLPVVLRISDFGLICPQAHLFDGKAACTKCLGGNFFHAIQKRCVRESRTAGLIKGFGLVLNRLLGCRDRIDAYAFPSMYTLEKFVEAGFPRKKLHYLPTPVDAKAISPSASEGEHILYLGRLVPEKGVHHLLEAYRKIVGEKPDLIVVGAQGTTRYAQCLIDEYREASFHNFISSEKTGVYIKNAMCVVIPSVWYENLPNVLLEAYAHGKPVIAPAHGCFPELVIDGLTGLLYEPNDVNSLREKLVWATEHRSELATMGKNGRALAEERFSPKLHYDTLMSIFSSVI